MCYSYDDDYDWSWVGRCWFVGVCMIMWCWLLGVGYDLLGFSPPPPALDGQGGSSSHKRPYFL